MAEGVEITDLDRAWILGTLSPTQPFRPSELARDCEMTRAQVQTVISDARKKGWPVTGSALGGYLLQLGHDNQYRTCREWLDTCWDQIVP